MQIVTINTKAWTRGEYCKNNGKCCAIGFLAKANLKKRGIKNPTVQDIEDEAACLGNFPEWDDITDANDRLFGEERRKALRKSFKEAGYRVRFV
jgi:uroporphyrinogen-III synthase